MLFRFILSGIYDFNFAPENARENGKGMKVFTRQKHVNWNCREGSMESQTGSKIPDRAYMET